MGTSIPSRSVCWHADLVVGGSGCHQAEDKLGEHKDSARVGEMGRRQHAPNAGHSLVSRWSDNAFQIQVGMERPAEMVPRDSREVLMENKVARTYLRRADFEQWGVSAKVLSGAGV